MNLLQQPREIGRGNLDRKAKIISNDELGQLGMTFNKMIDDLKDKTVSRDYLDNVINSMIDIVLIIDNELNINMINRSAERLLGYSREYLIGKPYDILCSDKDGSWTNAKMLYGKEACQILKHSIEQKTARTSLWY